MKNILITIFFTTGFLSTAFAEIPQRYQGCYEVKSGHIETLATSLFTDSNPLLRQQGMFSVRLKRTEDEGETREGRHKKVRIRKWIRIQAGVLVGELSAVTAGPVIKHTLTNDNRDGVIISEIGQLLALEPAGTSQICADPKVFDPVLPIPGVYSYDVVEVLSEFSGNGSFEGLEPDSLLVVEGQINFCNGRNEFELVDGQLCFDERTIE